MRPGIRSIQPVASSRTHDAATPAPPADHPARSARVVIGHPGTLVRLGFAELFKGVVDVELCASTATATHTLAAMRQYRPDLLVLAVDFLGPVLRATHIPRLLLVSPHDHVGTDAALDRACAYSSEQETTASLLQILRETIDCTRPSASPKACWRCPLKESLAPGSLPLSEREQQVFDLISGGWITSKIAARLGLSVKTVETYRGNIKNKLGLPSSSALVEAAMLWRRGIRLPAA